jgi:hemerythrin-like domain-containing protein
MRITDAIRGEHAAMRPLLRQLRELTEPGSTMRPEFVKEHAKTLWTIIRAHTTVEEPLFLLLRGHGSAKHALDEHKQIELLLKLAMRTGDQRVFNKGIRLTLGHFDEEERDVFPLAERVLGQAKLAQLGVEWLQARGLT